MKIVFVDATPAFNPARLDKAASGGIVTSMTKIPQHLASKGHEVYVISNHETEEAIKGVNYTNKKIVNIPLTFDAIVFNRNLISKANVVGAKARGAKVYWWLHDIVDPRYLDDDGFNYVDTVVSLSDYCSWTYQLFYEMPKSKFVKIPNGIDPSIWYPGEYKDRDPNLFLAAAAPIKGYKALEFAVINLTRLNPKAVLEIYSSSKLHEIGELAAFKEWKERIAKLFPNNVKFLDPIPQAQLAEKFRKAWSLWMPNEYPEMCSNLILQARATGLPVVTSNIGGAPEWVIDGETGLITNATHPHDKFLWQLEFTKKALLLTVNKKLHKYISETGQKGLYNWDQIGEMWNCLIKGESNEAI
jgi:glycosyltransferase involved in cell wall biosynthesis